MAIPNQSSAHRRSDTPTWLRTYAERLYDGRCLRCGETRPLDVCHIDDWPAVRAAAAALTADKTRAMRVTPEVAHDVFHQPQNVILLCKSCHGLLDIANYEDVTTKDIVSLRDAELMTERALIVMREYFCRGWLGKIGSHRRPNPVFRWATLLDWLQLAYGAGKMPGPHRFRLSQLEIVDIPTATILSDPDNVEVLPRWDHGVPA